MRFRFPYFVFAVHYLFPYTPHFQLRKLSKDTEQVCCARNRKEQFGLCNCKHGKEWFSYRDDLYTIVVSQQISGFEIIIIIIITE